MFVNWYLIRLESKLKQLYELRKEASKEELDKIDSTINTIQELICGEQYMPFIDLGHSLDYESKCIDEYASIWHVVEPMAFTQELPEKDKYISIPKLSDDDIVALVYDFCKDSLDRELFKIARSILKKNREFINMRSLYGSCSTAESFYLQYFNQVYVLLRRQNNFSDLVDLSHEIGHGLQFKTNYGKTIFTSLEPFSEIVSVFLELLSMEYFGGLSEFQNVANYNRIVTFNTLREHSEFFWAETEVLDLWKKLGKKCNKRIFELLSLQFVNALNINYRGLDDVDFLMSLGLSDKFKYCASYIFAIEFLELYRKDRDLGLYLLKQFIQLPLNVSLESYYVSMLDLGLTPGESLESYKSHIMKPIK